jgi:hypothetical protein
VDLFLQSCTTQGFATFDAIQAKEKNYRDWHPTNQFLPLAIEIFSCLHKHVDAFLHYCANVIWSLKGPEGPSPFYLGYFSLSKNLIYNAKDASILHLKLSNDSRPSYFLTSTLSRPTPHCHNWPITSS